MSTPKKCFGDDGTWEILDKNAGNFDLDATPIKNTVIDRFLIRGVQYVPDKWNSIKWKFDANIRKPLLHEPILDKSLQVYSR